MEQAYAPKQQETASTVQSGKETKKPSRLPMDVMRSLVGADGGRRISLSDDMQSKMQRAFGLDMSGVKLYESPGVSDAGAAALAQGDTVSFAPGKADFSSHSGQALLGHELSHVASQARGEVRGGGLLENSALEARADREGELAAAGKQVTPETAAPVSVAPVSSGPVQGKEDDREETKPLGEKLKRIFGQKEYDDEKEAAKKDEYKKDEYKKDEEKKDEEKKDEYLKDEAKAEKKDDKKDEDRE